MPYEPDDDQPPLDPPEDQEEDAYLDAEVIIAAHMNDQAQQTEDRRQTELRHQVDHNPGSLMWKLGNPRKR